MRRNISKVEEIDDKEALKRAVEQSHGPCMQCKEKHATKGYLCEECFKLNQEVKNGRNTTK